MRWGGFAFALLVACVLQKGVLALLPAPAPAFDAFLILALLSGLLMRKHDARLAGWLVGFVQDLAGADALGIHAFTLGLTALLITRLREIGNMNVWWMRALVAFIAAWPPQVLYLMHLYYWSGSGSQSFGGLLWTSALTSALAALIVTFINALPWILRSRRRRYRSFP